MINKADMKGWTPKKHLQGWTPAHGWAPHKVKRNVPIREGKMEHDPVTVERLKRDPFQEGGGLPDGEVTVERLERAVAVCAYIVVLDGPKRAPLFERLERELAVMRQTEDTVERAKRLLESYRDRHPLLSLPPPIDQIEDGLSTGVHSAAPQL
ncbi:hypothetical protein KUL72_31705 [Bradyrhizobium arachidis]|uniref:hypothetical protein n=1 Tax=Bradyrhizobium arachidis TaxID=858423 RepID=UPI0021626AE3|nr:hypothetical protein [Bradyrhizobium arachidis]UVO35840.1 hypothetical protein KUL72_31705 [Bradyrhizobium arachidis]